MTLQARICVFTSEKQKLIVTQNLFMNADTCFVHNWEKLEAIQSSSRSERFKQSVVARGGMSKHYAW